MRDARSGGLRLVEVWLTLKARLLYPYKSGLDLKVTAVGVVSVLVVSLECLHARYREQHHISRYLYEITLSKLTAGFFESCSCFQNLHQLHHAPFSEPQSQSDMGELC